MTTRQWIRKISLLIGTETDALDLSNLHIKFTIKRGDVQTPNTANIRVYNLSNETAQRIQNEFTRVVLQAGYESNFGVIFDGTVKQIRRGRENATDTYLDILGADGDSAYNFAIVNQSVSSGATQADMINSITKSMADYGVSQGYIPPVSETKYPRGRAIFGMARDHMRVAAKNLEASWSVQDGKVQFVPVDSYLPGEATVINSATGMVGIPEQTNLGIRVRCLLNPNLKIGSRIHINNGDIQDYRVGLDLNALAVTNAFVPSKADDGFYRILWNEYVGDTRGNEWYSDIICLSMSDIIPISAQGKIGSVAPGG